MDFRPNAANPWNLIIEKKDPNFSAKKVRGSVRELNFNAVDVTVSTPLSKPIGVAQGAVFGLMPIVAGEIDLINEVFSGSLFGNAARVSGSVNAAIASQVFARPATIAGLIQTNCTGQISGLSPQVSGDLIVPSVNTFGSVFGLSPRVSASIRAIIQGEIIGSTATIAGSVQIRIPGEVSGLTPVVDGALTQPVAGQISGAIFGNSPTVNGSMQTRVTAQIFAPSSSVNGLARTAINAQVFGAAPTVNGSVNQPIPGSVFGLAPVVDGSITQPATVFITGDIFGLAPVVNGVVRSLIAHEVLGQSPVVNGTVNSRVSAEVFGLTPTITGTFEGSTEETITYLSDMTWTSDTGTFGGAWRDERQFNIGSGARGPIVLDGITYPKGIGCHPDAETVIDISAVGAHTFAAIIGVDDAVGGGSVIFRVLADSVQIYESATLTKSSASVPIELDITGVDTLSLVTLQTGDGGYEDWADWADAKLISGG